MPWQEQFKDLPESMRDESWPSPEAAEFWKYAYFGEVSAILFDQVPKLFKKSDEVKKALATCYLWIFGTAVTDESIQTVLVNQDIFSKNSIELAFQDPMASYVLDLIGIKTPPEDQSVHTWLEGQKDIRRKFASEYRINVPKAVSKPEAVEFMQNNLGLQIPEIL